MLRVCRWTTSAGLLGALAVFSCSNPANQSAPPLQAAAPATTTAADSTSTVASPTTRPLPATAPATIPSQSTAQLTIHVTGLRNHMGQLIFGVFTSADGFPSEPSKSVNWQTKDADADTVDFTAALPPGVYGASVLHDENRNNKMDKNLAGIPLEGYGVTNNPKPRFRAATFKESTFTLPPEGATMTISLQYF